MRSDLDAWEAAVPDDTWGLLADFEEASEIISTPSAESILLLRRRGAIPRSRRWWTHMWPPKKSERARKLANAEQTRLSSVLKFELDNQARRLAGALRGDS